VDVITAFSIVLIILAIGDIISIKTKAFIPSVFMSAMLFLIGFWTFLPKDLIEIAAMGNPLATLSMYLLITHIGTMISVRDLAAQWKTVIIALGGVVGICLGTLTIGKLLFGWDAVVVATPPLTGGIVAALMMQEAAAQKGLLDLSVLAIVMYVMQGFAGYPLTAICLRKEGNRLLKLYRGGAVDERKVKEATSEGESSKYRAVLSIPEKYRTPYTYLATVAITAWASVLFATAINEVVSRFIICLIFGAIAAEIGFVERKPLNLSGSFGFLLTVLMAFIFAGLANATLDMLFKIVASLLGIIIIGVAFMAVVSIILGKMLGYSKEMAFAIALTALYGFPPNYVLTEEAAKALAKTPEEKEYLMDEMLPKMLVGGFATVTIASVIIAGIFIKLL